MADTGAVLAEGGAVQAALAQTQAAFAAKDNFKRCNFSFQARLIQSPEQVQQFCGALIGAARSCRGLRLTYGRRQIYVHRGRKQIAQFLFKGRTLCAAFALDPAEFAGTKYHGDDLSRYKRFAQTPMLLRIPSPRKLRYALRLFARVAGVPEAQLLAAPPVDCTHAFVPTEQLIAVGLVKPVGR